MMESLKSQAPNLKEASSSKSQMESVGYLDWDEDLDAELILRDEGAGGQPRDLEERTARFGESAIRFCKKVPRNPINDRLIGQLTGASTSVGANYAEANEGVSKKDFRYSVSRAKKEAKESRFFLRMIAASEPDLAEEARRLYREANELLLILSSIYRK